MTTVEALRGVRELLAVPDRWTKDQYARTEGGAFTDPSDPEAVCFCVIGGLARVMDSPVHVVEHAPIRLILAATAPRIDDESATPVDTNDEITHGQLMEWLDRAIARAESEAHQC